MRSRSWLAALIAAALGAGCGASSVDAGDDATRDGAAPMADAGADEGDDKEPAASDASQALAGGAEADAAGTDAGFTITPLVQDAGAVDAGASADSTVPTADASDDAATATGQGALPYAGAVASFSAGSNAGFGQDEYPDIVLGPPQGGGTMAGSLDVLSLGVGGEIVIDFGDVVIVDGSGADFVVFENPFWPGGDPTRVFAELGEVSVSEDGATWHTFACDVQGSGDGEFPGCAGWTPTLMYDPLEVVPLDPAQTGGDAFDLADVGVTRARFVRIVDLATVGEGSTAGFDLDALGLVHYEAAP